MYGDYRNLGVEELARLSRRGRPKPVLAGRPDGAGPQPRAEHQDLDVLGGVAPREERQPAEQPDHEQIDARVPRVEAEVRCSARVLAPHCTDRMVPLTTVGIQGTGRAADQAFRAELNTRL